MVIPSSARACGTRLCEWGSPSLEGLIFRDDMYQVSSIPGAAGPPLTCITPRSRASQQAPADNNELPIWNLMLNGGCRPRQSYRFLRPDTSRRLVKVSIPDRGTAARYSNNQVRIGLRYPKSYHSALIANQGVQLCGMH